MNSIPEDEMITLSGTTERLSITADGTGVTSNRTGVSAATTTTTTTCNREVLVVENKGLKVSYHRHGATYNNSMGRITVATRSFELL